MDSVSDVGAPRTSARNHPTRGDRARAGKERKASYPDGADTRDYDIQDLDKESLQRQLEQVLRERDSAMKMVGELQSIVKGERA